MQLMDFTTQRPGSGAKLPVGDDLYLDQAALADRRDELEEWLKELDVRSCTDWSSFLEYTDGDKLAAHLAIYLGDLLGVWVMHPARHMPQGLQDAVRWCVIDVPSLERGHTKPSRGDLEVGTEPCEVCGLPMGPADSLVHDLRRAGETRRCTTCPEAAAAPSTVTEPKEVSAEDAWESRLARVLAETP